MFDQTGYPPLLGRDEIGRWLREADQFRLAELWRKADAVREAYAGPNRHLYGAINISNRCVHRCSCCEIRATNSTLTRRRLTAEQIMEAAAQATALGCGGLVLQAGEDPDLTRAWLSDIIVRIKGEFPLRLLLSAGERSRADLLAWRTAGLDGYIIGLDKSTPRLRVRAAVPRMPPPGLRVAPLHAVQMLGLVTGSVLVVGLPGQTWDSLIDELLQFRELDVGFLSIAPFKTHASTQLRFPIADCARSISNDWLMVNKLVALARILRPSADIASSGTHRIEQERNCLRNGANAVVMDLTPPRLISECDVPRLHLTNACTLSPARQCHPLVLKQIDEVHQLLCEGDRGIAWSN